jgi:hypothetical protein
MVRRNKLITCERLVETRIGLCSRRTCADARPSIADRLRLRPQTAGRACGIGDVAQEQRATAAEHHVDTGEENSPTVAQCRGNLELALRRRRHVDFNRDRRQFRLSVGDASSRNHLVMVRLPPFEQRRNACSSGAAFVRRTDGLENGAVVFCPLIIAVIVPADSLTW